MPSDYFDEGTKATEDSNYNKAISCFKYIVDNHPHNKLYPESYYNLGILFFYENKTDSAQFIFKSILKSDFNEREAKGGDIMGNPYANYKHNAAEMLSDMYNDKKSYDTALYYFTIADTVYPYLHFCGNALAENKIGNALEYADLYEHLNDNINAENKLLAVVFIEGIANIKPAVDRLQKLFQVHNNKQQLKTELNYAVNHYLSDTDVYNKKDTSYSYYIRFLNQKLFFDLPFEFEFQPGKQTPESIVAYLKETPFYKMVEDL